MTDYSLEMSSKEKLLLDLAALEALVENNAYQWTTLQELQSQMMELIRHDDIFSALRLRLLPEAVQ